MAQSGQRLDARAVAESLQDLDAPGVTTDASGAPTPLATPPADASVASLPSCAPTPLAEGLTKTIEHYARKL